jgi:hypothetical protein
MLYKLHINKKKNLMIKNNENEEIFINQLK